MSDSQPDDVKATVPAPVPAGVTLRLAGTTDVGRIREHNEDNYLLADLTSGARGIEPACNPVGVGARGVVLAVCDGMGGAAAGEVASQMAVDIVYSIVQDGAAPRDRDQFAQRLVASIQEAGARIFLAAKSDRSRRGMGTTSTVAGVFDRTLFVGQVGDSRAYLLRGTRFRQITKDQSLVSKLIEAGQLTEAEAETYEHSHIILQALGTADTVSVDLSYVELRAGDTVMLCSDGLSGLITSEQMREVLTTVDDPGECCLKLTALANEAGGHDNVTVIVARFGGDLPEATAEDATVGYQPYVLMEPVEAMISGRASTSMKEPDLPPPGSDLKHSVSTPPDPPTDSRRHGSEDDGDDLRLPLDARSGTLGWLFVLLALAAVALAGWLLLRHRAATARRGETPAAPVEVAAPARPDPVTAVPVFAPTVLPRADGGARADGGG